LGLAGLLVQARRNAIVRLHGVHRRSAILAPPPIRATMSTVLVPLLVFAVVGGVASAWLYKVREPRERLSTGLMALSAMHWRELQRLVVAAMQERGFRPLAAPELPGEDGLVPLLRDDATWLLSTKHGTAYVLGTAAVGEFANAMQLRGAQGGLMVTAGEVRPDTRSLARTQRIEVLDGRTLWAEVAPLLEAEQRRVILGAVHARTRRDAAIAWGAALALAALVFVARPGDPPVAASTVRPEAAPQQPATPAPRTPAAEPAAPASPSSASPPAAAAPSAAPARAAPAPASETVPEDPAALAQRRRTLARSVATLPWIVRAGWSTQSTLVIHLQPGATVDKPALCNVVEAYPELRASRLQLQATGDNAPPVRFMQCRVY
jgi:restriction system protein